MSLSLSSLAANLLYGADKNFSATVSLSEYQTYLKDQKLPVNMATNAMLIFDKNKDGLLSQQELIDGYSLNFDADKDDKLAFNEMINLQNSLSKIVIDSSINQTAYNNLLYSSKSFFSDADANEDGQISASEYQTVLANNNFKTSGSNVFLSFFDENKDGSVNLLEYQKKSIALDINEDGMLSTTETAYYTSQLTKLTSIETNAQALIDNLDTKNTAGVKDGALSAAEYATFLASNKLPSNMANSLISYYDTNGDKVLSSAELIAAQNSFDTDGNGTLNFTESLAFQNSISITDINLSTTQTQYNSLYSLANSVFTSADTDKDNAINLTEYQKILEASNYNVSGASSFISLYDSNHNGSVDILEYQKKSIELDTDKDGKINATEAEPFINTLTKLTNIEIAAKAFIKGLDIDTNTDKTIDNRDGVVDFTEYSNYLATNKMPSSIALNIMTEHDLNKDSALSYSEWVLANQAFDADGDGALNFAETLSFQNSVSDIKFDIAMDQTQYTNLFNAGKSFMALDLDLDGDVSLEEYRAALLTPNTKTGATQPEYYAENLMMLFDSEQTGVYAKDSKINIFEYMKGLMVFDKDGDGKLNAVESLALKNNLDNTKLFDNVNNVITKVDFNNDKNISLEEYKSYVTSQGLPASIASEAINLFDADKDETMNRLELMQAYKKFDVNNNNNLDIDETLSLYNTLSKNITNLNIDPANIKQYTNMFQTLQNSISELDQTNDGLLNTDELKTYLKNMGLSADYANTFITKYDASADGKIDLLELMKSNISFDADKSGDLNFTEQLQLDSSISGIALNATPDNQTQYQNLYNQIKTYINTYDLTKDNKLNQTELNAFFKANESPAYFSQNLISNYGNTANGTIDLLQLLKAYTDYDKNLNGVLEFNENLALQIDQSEVDLTSTEANQKQNQSLYTSANQNILTFDKTSDQQLNVSELSDYFVSKGFSGSLASEAVKLYDANENGSLDAIELLKANVDFDTNTNGVLDFNEFLAQNAKFAQTSIPSDAGSATTVNGNFQTTTNIINSYDISKDKNLSQDELRSYFNALNMPNYMADNFATLYDSNKDGLLNNFELMKGLIDSDSNKSGVLDFSENINMYANLSGTPISVTAENKAQMSAQWSTASGIMGGYDANADKKLTETEIGVWFKNMGLPQYMADSFIAKYKNTDGAVDTIKMLQAISDIDNNKNGALEFEDLIKLYSDISTVKVDLTAENKAQIAAQWGTASGIVGGYDTNADRKLTAAEIGVWFKNMNLPQYMADSFVAKYKNTDGTVDAMKMLQAITDIDNNKNGALEFEDLMKLYSDISTVKVDLTETNKAQVSAQWSTASGIISGYDANGDRKLTTTEIGVWFKNMGLPQYMADSFIAKYKNTDGTVDAMKMMQAITDIDNNKNGALEFNDLMKLYSDISGANIDLTNLSQVSAQWGTASGIIGGYDANGDKKLTAAEVGVWFKNMGLPQYMADNFVAQYKNIDGTVDAMKMLQAITNIDNNKNGALEFEDLMKLYSDISTVKIDLTAANKAQIAAQWGTASGIIGGYDTNGDKKLTAAEVGVWFNNMGMPQYMADNFITQYKNADGTVDALKMLQAVMAIDSNKNGAVEAEDILNLKNSVM